MQTIPVINMQDLQDPLTRSRTIQQIGDALTNIGFFAIINHNVKLELIQQAYATAEDFFNLTDKQKKQYEDVDLRGQRGFTSFGREHAKDSNHPDLKEFWHVGREAIIANKWPQEVSNFKPVFQELYNELEKCSNALLEACSIYLGLEENTLPSMTREGNNILRVIHYPPIPESAHPASLRAAPHEDINFITLLPAATDAGLELLQRDGSWLPIHSVEGQIIVDSGDMIQELTGGRFKSTTHRVVNPHNSRSRRFSMPYFVHPRSEIRLSKRYLAGEYLIQRLRELGL